jgi:hypothetical protein
VGKVGSASGPDDPEGGAWRVLQMRLTDLATAPPITADDSQVAGGLALEIERTLGTLNKESIKEIRAEIKNLPKVLSSLEISRKNDILLNVLAQTTEPKSARHYEAAKKKITSDQELRRRRPDCRSMVSHA